jgi:hypothetical protein
VKELIIRLLAVVGVVPARRYNALLRESVGLRTSAQAWKQRANAAMERAKALEGELSRHVRLIKEARRTLDKARQDTELTKLKDQLARTERELLLAREHLMAIEVKLDILEGAANVLDSRTRVAIAQSSRSGATV